MTFQKRMDLPRWIKRFTRAGLPGAYLRVVKSGPVAAGDPVVVTHRPAHGVTIGEVFAGLTPERARAVLESAARRASWGTPLPGEGRGRWIGWASYKGFGAWCAVVAEVELTHEVNVRRLVIAADVGLAVNPDGVANQMEGGAIQAASWTVREAVRFVRTRVTSGSWEAYPILRFSEVPRVEVEVLQHADEPSLGAGEAAQGPTAAAIANAVRAAIGVRVHDLPITAERIASASVSEEAQSG